MLYNLKNKIIINLDKLLYAEPFLCTGRNQYYLRLHLVDEQTSISCDSISFDTEEELIEAMNELVEATKNV